MEHYQRILDIDKHRNAEYRKRFHGMAGEAIRTIRRFDRADVTRVADGAYTARSTDYNGPVTGRLTVSDRRIKDIEIVSLSEKQFYAAFTDTPNQIIAKQSVSDIDGTKHLLDKSAIIVRAGEDNEDRLMTGSVGAQRRRRERSAANGSDAVVPTRPPVATPAQPSAGETPSESSHPFGLESPF